MNGDVLGFIAFDEILRLVFGGVVGVALERHIGNHFLYDSAADAVCFRIPGCVIAVLNVLAISSVATERETHAAKQWSGEKRCQPRFQRHEGYCVLA